MQESVGSFIFPQVLVSVLQSISEFVLAYNDELYLMILIEWCRGLAHYTAFAIILHTIKTAQNTTNESILEQLVSTYIIYTFNCIKSHPSWFQLIYPFLIRFSCVQFRCLVKKTNRPCVFLLQSCNSLHTFYVFLISKSHIYADEDRNFLTDSHRAHIFIDSGPPASVFFLSSSWHWNNLSFCN